MELQSLSCHNKPDIIQIAVIHLSGGDKANLARVQALKIKNIFRVRCAFVTQLIIIL